MWPLKPDTRPPVVCFPLASVDASTIEALQVLRHYTGPPVTVVVPGNTPSLQQLDAQLDAKISDGWLQPLTVESTSWTALIAAAIRATHPHDIALLLPGVRVGEGWLWRLRAAALSDTTVASATPLCIGAGAVELFDEGETRENGLESTVRRIEERSLHLRPKISVLGPACVYIRRAALELAGPPRDSGPWEAAATELAERMNALGMVHILADDVLVSSHPVGGELKQSDTLASSIRETLANDSRGSLHRARLRAQTALRKISVTIDGRALTETSGGTQSYVIGLILALMRESEVALRVLVPPDFSSRASRALRTAGEVELLTYDDALERPAMTDVVHRPQQVFTPDDLALLRLVGERVVVGQQDLIAYHNYSYHREVEVWRSYRRTTRLALAVADQVIFFSEHAMADALAEDLLPEARAHVVGVGAEPLELELAPPTQSAGLEIDDPFLLCLGADYAHKNRPFAIELLAELRALGWGGRLVLAGAHVQYGSSRERERELLRGSPQLAEFVLDLGEVDEAARIWLSTHACALLYPTTYEGFGLLPLEAARFGVPCLFAPQASLGERLEDAAVLIPWDARASAAASLPLLIDGRARQEHLARLRAPSAPSWPDIARQLVGVYEQALAMPSPGAAPRVWQELDREGYIVTLDRDMRHLKTVAQEYQDAFHALEARVRPGLPLIDEGGLLSPDQQRGLMRVARSRVGALALKALGPAGRVRRRRVLSFEGTGESNRGSDT